ncbi:MAG: hypothetical protein QOC65_113 [Sphingomonadales bacterium]|nr:hypothetical protein [Sphingomonadales bacterium]
MQKAFPALAAALSALCALPAAAQPAPAQPARWHLDGATDRCVLSRRLEGTPLPATFILRTIPGSGRYDMILAAPDLPGDLRRPSRTLSVHFAPAGQPHAVRAALVDLPGALGEGAVYGPLSAQIGADLARATAVQVADEQGRALGSWAIPLGARAAEALAYCEAEKLVDWGADPAGFEPGATRPRPREDAGRWLTQRDFGLATALTSAAYAAVFRLTLDREGRATACTLIESAGNVDLAGACRALRSRARYEPARDAAGNAIVSVAIHIVSVRMETEIRFIPG